MRQIKNGEHNGLALEAEAAANSAKESDSAIFNDESAAPEIAAPPMESGDSLAGAAPANGSPGAEPQANGSLAGHANGFTGQGPNAIPCTTAASKPGSEITSSLNRSQPGSGPTWEDTWASGALRYPIGPVDSPGPLRHETMLAKALNLEHH